ncbi:MAG: hypothetical protein Q4B68_06780 [Bacteroidales bacterium]|nr:hypothetical protein [Bacteroidales bacterium]
MKRCYSYNFTRQDCKLFKIRLNEFKDIRGFFRRNSARSVIDTFSCEFGLMCFGFEDSSDIDYDKAWYKLLHLLFGFCDGYDIKAEIEENIAYKLQVYHDYEDEAKRALSRYIYLLRTGDYSNINKIIKILSQTLSVGELVDLLKEELLARAVVYRRPEYKYAIVEIVDYYHDYDALYNEYGVDTKDKNSEPCAEFVKLVTTSEHTKILMSQAD